MKPIIPLPADNSLSAETKELLASAPPLNVFRMFANARQALKALANLPAPSCLKASLIPEKENSPFSEQPVSPSPIMNGFNMSPLLK